MVRPLVVVCAACAFTGAVVLAQAPGAPQATFRTGVNVVQLDVSVLDRNHRPVQGLTPTDFTILERGKEQSIVAFTRVDVPPRLADPPAAWMRDAASDVVTNALDARRLVVIVMDDAGTAFDPGVAKIARLVATAAVDELGPADLASVVFTFQGRDQNFTADRGRLLKAVESFSPQPAALACMFRRGGCTVDKLLQIGDVLRAAPPGRKSVIYVGSGPGLTVSTERDAQMSFAQDMFRQFQQANINVNAFDANGLQTFAAAATDRSSVTAAQRILLARVGQDDLNTLAGNTGGRTFSNTNTPWVHVPDVFRENSSYYLIGFQSNDPKTDGRFRKVQVKVNRADVEVRTRSGYFAPTKEKPQASNAPAPSPLDAALANGLPSGDLPVGVSVAAFASPGDRREADVVVVSHVQPSAAGAASDAARRDPAAHVVTLAATAFDKEGDSRGTAQQTMTFVATPGVTDPRYETILRLPVKPGRYDVGVAAESGGHTGGVFADIDVPNFADDPLSLSSLVLGRAPKSGIPVSGNVADLLPVVPATARVFTATDRVTAFLRVYQGGKGKPASTQVTTRIVNDLDKTVVDKTATLDAERFAADRAADHRIDLPLAELRPGQYLLRIEAALGARRVQRELRFTVK